FRRSSPQSAAGPDEAVSLSTAANSDSLVTSAAANATFSQLFFARIRPVYEGRSRVITLGAAIAQLARGRQAYTRGTP
ncbi:hypothetical protein BST46_29430, partial [Mycobacterium timonense]